MKNVITTVLVISLLTCVRGPRAYAQPAHAPTGGVASLAKGEFPQSVTGRITRLDTKSGRFSVRADDNGHVVDLVARKDVIARLRRGQRVVVTYEGNMAKKVEATTSEK